MGGMSRLVFSRILAYSHIFSLGLGTSDPRDVYSQRARIYHLLYTSCIYSLHAFGTAKGGTGGGEFKPSRFWSPSRLDSSVDGGIRWES